jgi:aminopeptidase N
MAVVAGGTVIREDDEAGAGAAGSERRSRLTIAAPYTRNQVVVLAAGLLAQTRVVGGITVRSWHRAGLELGARRTLDACAGSIALFSARFGAYPFSEFDVVAAPLGGDVGGMESTGLVLADERPYEAVRWMDKDSGPGVLPIFLLMIAAAHETGHQWWYSAVGSDPYHDPWLDESLTNWSGNFWMEQDGGAGTGGLAFGMCLTEAHNGPPVASMTSPGPSYPTHEAYGTVVYARGALFYQWLRRQMGEERFFAFLRAWYDERRWTVATPNDWHMTLARFATPEVLADADSHWLAGRGLTLTLLGEGAKPVKQ